MNSEFSDVKKTIQTYVKLLRYGFLLDYHLKKQNKLDSIRHNTVLKYHYEKADYYYTKIYG